MGGGDFGLAGDGVLESFSPCNAAPHHAREPGGSREALRRAPTAQAASSWAMAREAPATPAAPLRRPHELLPKISIITHHPHT